MLEWFVFVPLAVMAVASAAGMLVTMSMYRAGFALMSSFVALAGMFILLDADMLAAIQIMMNVGGMMVMILFMVMIMMDPGGEMMWDMKRKMKMPGLGAFSMSMPRGGSGDEHAAPEQQQQQREPAEHAQHGQVQVYTCPMHAQVRRQEPGQCPICGMDLVPAEDEQAELRTYTCPMHPEVRQQEPGQCPICGMDLVPGQEEQAAAGHAQHQQQQSSQGDGHAQHGGGGMSGQQHDKMMRDMAMSTDQLPWALALGAAVAAAFIAIAVATPWPVTGAAPAREAPVAVGDLLMSRYMIGFEGAAFLILAGIIGGVLFARRETEPLRQAVYPPPEEEGPVYTCPMHPEIRQETPGQCPICGMDLVPVEEEAEPAGEHAHGDH